MRRKKIKGKENIFYRKKDKQKEKILWRVSKVFILFFFLIFNFPSVLGIAELYLSLTLSFTLQV